MVAIAESRSVDTLKPCSRMTFNNLLHGEAVILGDFECKLEVAFPVSYLRKWLTFLNLWVLSSFAPKYWGIVAFSSQREKTHTFSKQLRKNSCNSRAQRFT